MFVYTAVDGEKASDEQHVEAKEKLSNDEKPADIQPPSNIRQSINYDCYCFFIFFKNLYNINWNSIDCTLRNTSADVIVKPRLQLNKTKIKQFYFSLIFVVTAASSWKKNYFRAFLCKKSFEYIKKMNCLKYNDVYNSWNWFCQIFMNNRNYDY